MKTVPAEFLNADLDIKSAADLGALVEARENRVLSNAHPEAWPPLAGFTLADNERVGSCISTSAAPVPSRAQERLGVGGQMLKYKI